VLKDEQSSRRYLLERMLKLSDAGVKNRWIERVGKSFQKVVTYDYLVRQKEKSKT